MDVELLHERGVEPRNVRHVWLDGWRLVIGARAYLVAHETSVVEGLVMDVDDAQLERLYSDKSVSEYVAVEMAVRDRAGGVERVSCYNLPHGDPAAKQDAAYRAKLVALGRRIGLSASYLSTL